MNKILRIYRTVIYLKSIQIWYRLYFSARRKWRKLTGHGYPVTKSSKTVGMKLQPSIASYISYKEGAFTFLNLRHDFEGSIDFDFAAYGKLWTYNLTYFDFLHQPTMSKKEGLELIQDFIAKIDEVRDGLQPFPISLRGINWIKFMTNHDIHDQVIGDSLYAQYYILMDNIEYHLLGNHLLENGFSLLFGAYYFEDEKLYAKAKEILTTELEEQILSDGAHFELSPMYHQIMLYRVLDCLNLVQNNPWMSKSEDGLMGMLKEKAVVMLKWLNAISYENGTIPLLNDSANGIAPTTKQLNDYAARLHITHPPIDLSTHLPIHPSTHLLKESGYRKITKPRYECIIDVGNIGPDYIPGHAHADTFNFELFLDGKPTIVDTGISTYEINDRRTLERSTVSHNTVEIDGMDQSEIWGGFRVARRAKVTELKEENDFIEATHNGYERIGVLHTRKFKTANDSIVIEDIVTSKKRHKCIAYLHFFPGIDPQIVNDKLVCQTFEIKLENHIRIEKFIYEYANGFNSFVEAKAVKISFEKNLRMEITI